MSCARYFVFRMDLMEYQSLNSFILPLFEDCVTILSLFAHLDSLKRSRKLDVFYSHLNYFFIKIRITRELFVSRRDKRLELNRSRLKIFLYFNFEKENTFHNRTIIHLYPDSTFRSSFQINEFPEKNSLSQLNPCMFLALHSKLNRASRGERERERMKLLKREPGDGSLGSKKLLDLFPPLFPKPDSSGI